MYKKIGVIGDLHGRNYWEEFVKDTTVDLWIFLGDYVDSFHYENVEILHNLKKVIMFKILNPDKVILLLGNHDISYIYKEHTCLAGFRPGMELDLYNLFSRNLEHFQMVFTYQNLVFSHAGITNTWVKKYGAMVKSEFNKVKAKFKLPTRKGNPYTLFEKINWLQHSEFGRRIIFSPCYIRNEYRHNVGGIIWVDRNASKYDGLTGYHQFVGHTPVDGKETYGDDKTSMNYCDILRYKNKDFVIINFEE